MNDNFDKNLNLENLEDLELEQVSGGRKKPTPTREKKKPEKHHGNDGQTHCPRCKAVKWFNGICPNCGYPYDDTRK